MNTRRNFCSHPLDPLILSAYYFKQILTYWRGNFRLRIKLLPLARSRSRLTPRSKTARRATRHFLATRALSVLQISTPPFGCVWQGFRPQAGKSARHTGIRLQEHEFDCGRARSTSALLRLPASHTGNTHCSRIPRFVADRPGMTSRQDLLLTYAYVREALQSESTAYETPEQRLLPRLSFAGPLPGRIPYETGFQKTELIRSSEKPSVRPELRGPVEAG